MNKDMMDEDSVYTYVHEYINSFKKIEPCPECHMDAEFEVHQHNNPEKVETRHLWRFGKSVIVFRKNEKMYGVRCQCSRCGEDYFLLTKGINDPIRLYNQFDFPLHNIFTTGKPYYNIMICDLFYELHENLTYYRKHWSDKERYIKSLKLLYNREKMLDKVYHKHEMCVKVKNIVDDFERMHREDNLFGLFDDRCYE